MRERCVSSGGTGRRVAELDGLRGVAILLVVVSHFTPLAGGGWVGVNVFFVLSGYLITSMLLTERKATGRLSLVAFYGRRARRLLPALIVLMAVVALVDRQGFAHALPSVVLYAANWSVAMGDALEPVGHMWSLAIEEQFYLVWPAVVGLLGRRALPVAAGVAVAAITLRVGLVLAGTSDAFVYNATVTRLDAIMIGSALAFLPRLAIPWILPTAIVAALVVMDVPYFQLMLGLPLSALATAVLVTARPGWLAWRPLTFMGSISYGLYLWHWPLILWFGRNPLIFGLAISVSYVSLRIVERPFLRPRQPHIERVAGIVGGEVEVAGAVMPHDVLDELTYRQKQRPAGCPIRGLG